MGYMPLPRISSLYILRCLSTFHVAVTGEYRHFNFGLQGPLQPMDDKPSPKESGVVTSRDPFFNRNSGLRKIEQRQAVRA